MASALALTASFALFAATPHGDWDEEIHAAMEDVRPIFPVPEALVRAVIHTESGGDARELSSAGAVGLMQVMPFNARKLGLRSEAELWEPSKNVLAGTRLLAVLLKHFEGDVVRTLVAYNAGPGALSRKRLPEETRGYVRKVLARFRALSQRSACASRRHAGPSYA